MCALIHLVMFMLILFAFVAVTLGDETEAQHVKQPSIGTTTHAANVSSTALGVTFTDRETFNIWYVSDDGSCRNLQTVLDRASDGADIYVTSDTLSLDGHKKFNSPFCLINSSLSYTISHLDNNQYTVICSGLYIDWTISENDLVKKRGPTTVTVNHGGFSDHTLFTLHGRIYFNYCSFKKRNMMILIYGSHYNISMVGKRQNETVRSSIVSNRLIKIFKSKISSTIYIYSFQMSCKVELNHCDLKGKLHIDSNFPKNCPLSKYEGNFPVILLQIDHGSVSDSDIYINTSPEIVPFVRVISVNMFNVRMKTINVNNHLVVHVMNSTWVNNDKNFMSLEVFSVKIISSEISSNCSACTLMMFHGKVVFKPRQHDYLPKTFGDHVINYNFPTLSLIETTLKFNGSLSNKITSKSIIIILKNSNLIIDDILSFKVDKNFKVQNLLVQCPVGKMVQRKLGQNDVIYSCNPACKRESMYSLQKGKLRISENVTIKRYEDGSGSLTQHSDPLQNNSLPSCQPCPLGAKCTNDIEALPNYWGYKATETSVSIIRCPDNYCCQGNETCSKIDSCNEGRTGTLCGSCKKNLTESIFLPKCVQTESCKSGLVITLFFSAALFYAVMMVPFSTVKNKMIFLLKKFKAKCTNKQKLRVNTETDDSGSKYLQILFYYVQDSKLFTVHLPQMDAKTDNIVVKFLEFTPGILAVYVQATELCFTFSSAIIKVALQLSFGFLVMLFLYLAYIGQIFLSYFIYNQGCLNDLKVKLFQGYLLTILFSYQKMVMETFILVQCLKIQDLTVLFIQANVECYTWWQIGILIYICISVVPIFFVLAHLPFYVKDKKMSVRVFTLACLFPLPVVIGYHMKQIFRYSADAFSDRSRNDIEFGEETEEKIKNTHRKTISGEGTSLVRNKKSPDDKIEAIPRHMLQTKPQNLENIIDILVDKDPGPDSICMGDVSEKENIKEKTETKLVEAEIKDRYSCRKVVVDCLLKHYKCLSVFGIRFTWLGVHKIYRVALVACRTFIIEPVKRLHVMSALVLAMTAANAIIRPYKDQRANITATLSYIANLCIAGLNLMKANYVTFGCDTNCHFRDVVVQYMDTVEDTLLLYAPLTSIGLWVIYKGIKKVLKKSE